MDAVTVEHVSKSFKIFTEYNNTLKASVMRRGHAKFERFQALDDVSFSVPAGSTYGIVGENGSGKSTMLKILANILRPESGTVTLNGRLSALLELGAGFHPELTGRENVYLNAAILGVSKKHIESRFDDIVDFAGIGKFIDNPVKNYSSGMYVRLGFAVAINVEPEILLIDEVLAVGDAEFQARCIERLTELKHGGCTIVLVSHGMDTVRNVCDRVCWLKNGKLMAAGHAEDVVDRYLDHVKEERTARMKFETVRLAADGHTERPALEAVSLRNLEGNAITSVPTLQPAVIHFAYRARDFAVEIRPMLSIFRSDGAWVATTQTGAPVPYIHDDLVGVDYTIPAMSLQPGMYEVSVSLRDPYLEEVYVDVERCLIFEVVAAGDLNMSGLVNLAGSWSSGVLERMPELNGGEAPD